MKKLLALAFAILFSTAAYAQNPGKVTNHAFVIGKGANVTGYTSLLCGSAQLAVGSATDPVCRTVSGDATFAATGVLTLATVNANVGTFGSTTRCITTTQNAKGLTTAISDAVCTPAVGNITGLGTGVATALGVNVGTAGAFVVNGGALGTPSGGTLTNATGLPIGTGVSGLATGVATFLGTPSSANLAAAVTDEVSAAGVSAKALFGTAGNLPATATNDNAATGNVGEYVESQVTSGAPVSITTSSVAQNLTSITLSAGDWDVSVNIVFAPVATTSVSNTVVSASLVTNTLDQTNGRFVSNPTATFVNGGLSIAKGLPAVRFSLSGSTTIFAVAFATFTVNAMTMTGIIHARRVR